MKRDENGKVIKFKALNVTRCLTQKRGVDREETYSPTVKMVTLRLLLKFAVQQDLKLKQLDVKTAYLDAEIDKKIFAQQPLGFEVLKDGEFLVCKLKNDCTD